MILRSLPYRLIAMRYLFLLSFAAFFVAATQAADAVDYTKDVAPILRKYCGGCHNQDDAEAGFNLESHSALLAGGDNGVVVTAGSGNSSRLLQMIRGTIDPVMPPEDEAQPSEDEVAVIETWIDQGAAGPHGDVPMTMQLSTPHITTAADVVAPVTAVAVSNDGSRLATARFGSVRIDADGKTLATIDQLPGKVNSLVFSADGKRLLVGSGLTGAYGRAAIYQSQSGKLLTEMIGHRDTIYSAVFSPDENWVATAGYDRDILLWDAGSGQAIAELTGHNGAIFDLAFSPDGKVLASACADETVKLWNVETGTRLDTLSQPEGEAFAVDFSKDGKFIVATSADNRLRVWRFVSKTKPRINPLVATRFVDESALVNFAFTPGGDALVVLAASGNIKVVRTDDWSQAMTLDPLGHAGSDLCVTPDGKRVCFAMMNGEIEIRDLPPLSEKSKVADKRLKTVYMDLGPPAEVTEPNLRKRLQDEPSVAAVMHQTSADRPVALPVDRGVVIRGEISQPGQIDAYQWQARRGEVWAIDADPIAESRIDPIVSITDEAGEPVLRVRLQATRDSYFTFRGKNSTQVNDFRVFNWQEMQLGQYFYAAGEVTRLWKHPRGPDSGFDVYPGEGNRWTYFGTTHSSHALGEPAYIVRPLRSDEPPVANGLPVFDVYYENDDDPMRIAGISSRLLFTAPRDGLFSAQVSDTRGDGGKAFGYRLTIRAADPDFVPTVAKVNTSLRPGTGREFTVRVDRIDGYTGPVTFDCKNLPPEVRSTFPVTIEHDQRFAQGTLWIDQHTESLTNTGTLEVIATAMIDGRRVERRAGNLGELSVGEPPSVIPTLHPIDRTAAPDEDWTLQVRRGETVTARVLLNRKKGFDNLVAFGKEDAGRNATQGVYVDNIGLNGLLLPEKISEREFFLTADPTAEPGKRAFFLRAQVDGSVTSPPITVEVLP
tara:strand:+ start:291196 stop:294021 length:2826 start_codon:yes stop_codon:yes gene_type:complete